MADNKHTASGEHQHAGRGGDHGNGRTGGRHTVRTAVRLVIRIGGRGVTLTTASVVAVLITRLVVGVVTGFAARGVITFL